MNDFDPAISPAWDAVAPPTRRLPVFLAAFLPLFAIYLAPASTDLPYHIDAATNVFTARTIGTTGSPILHEYAELAEPRHKGVFAWVVASERGPVSQYPPGTALLSAPLYALWSDATPISLSAANAPPKARVTVPIPGLWPAAVVAAFTTAAALGFVALTVLEAGGSRRLALASAFVGGLGTSAWTVAADQLWQHGPGMFWVSLGVYLAARNRWGWSGLAFSALVLTRPPVVVVGAALGMMLILRRQWHSAGWLTLGVAPGVVALLTYNSWLFGAPSIAGGYGGVYADRLIDTGVGAYLGNIGSALFDRGHGLLVWSPFLLIAAIGTFRGHRTLPAWSVAAGLGGLAYLLLLLRLNRSSGGEGFSFYRYPLEALTGAGSTLALGFQDQWSESKTARLFVLGAVVFAFVSHAVWA